MIFGSSVTRDIKKVAFDEQLDAGSANIHTFKAKTAKYITKYMTHHLEEDCPHTVVLAAGGNDIPRRRATERELEDIANCLIEGGVQCVTNYGVSRVFISSILPHGHRVNFREIGMS